MARKSKKVTSTLTTKLRVILDESSSMASCAAETVSAFNAYMTKQAEDKSTKLLVTLTTFNTQGIKVRYSDVAIADVPAMVNGTDYCPNAMTPLYDAVGQTIAEKFGDPTLVLILTDGEENSSHNYDLERVRTLIKQRESEGTTFVFLGADLSKQDVARMATSMGISANNAAAYAKANTAATMDSLSRSTSSYRATSASLHATGHSGAAMTSADYFGTHGDGRIDSVAKPAPAPKPLTAQQKLEEAHRRKSA